IITSSLDLVSMSHQLPGAGENAVLFFIESLFCEVTRSSQRGSARYVAVPVHLQVGHGEISKNYYSSAHIVRAAPGLLFGNCSLRYHLAAALLNARYKLR